MRRKPARSQPAKTQPARPQSGTSPAPTEEWVDASGRPIDEEDRGLRYDVGTLVSRRGALGLFGAVSTGALVAACGGSSATSPSSKTSTVPSSTSTSPAGPAASASPTSASRSTSGAEQLTEVPDETGGPYPADGTNGVDVLDDSGIVRRDIRSSFGSKSATAAGVPLSVRLTVRDASTGRAKRGAAVYVWHCDRDGGYSLYSSGLEDVNYLRGVQVADAEGTVEFTTIYPAAYSGRWPHIHFEVYEALTGATSDGPIVKTSQIALPEEACEAVYATKGYEQSVGNLASTSLSGDNVFGDDGGIHQIASMSGSVSGGYVAALTIGV